MQEDRTTVPIAILPVKILPSPSFLAGNPVIHRRHHCPLRIYRHQKKEGIKSRAGEAEQETFQKKKFQEDRKYYRYHTYRPRAGCPSSPRAFCRYQTRHLRVISPPWHRRCLRVRRDETPVACRQYHKGHCRGDFHAKEPAERCTAPTASIPWNAPTSREEDGGTGHLTSEISPLTLIGIIVRN